MANLKNINDLPVVESAEGLNLIANGNGAAKQIPAEFIGKVKTVNGASPDENGNVEVEIPEGFSGSWNDLKDKPFYTEPKTILERQVIDGFIEGDEAGYAVLLTHKIEYPDDVALTVFWDGIEYNCISVNGILGNTLPTTGEDNGVPFIIVKDAGSGNSGIIALAGFDGYTNASHEIGIVGETVHKLDAKYLPEINDIYANYDIVLHDIYHHQGSRHEVNLIKGDCSEIMLKIKKCKVIRYLVYRFDLSQDDTEGESTQQVLIQELAINGNAPEEYLFFDMGNSEGYNVFQDNTAEYWFYDD